MAKIERPLFGDQAGGGIAGLLTFRTRGGKTETMQQQKSTKEASTEQELTRAQFATAHAAWMLLTKQKVHINKRYYWRRIPDWPTFLRAWPTPTAPTNLTATSISTSQINLAWQDNSDNEEGFKIERKTGSTGTWAQITITDANATTQIDSDLAAGTAYYYRVRAYNVVGDSDYSSTANATTSVAAAPEAPTNLTATATAEDQINLAWHDNSTTETGFKIERKTGSAGTWAQIATVGANTTSYANTGLTAGTAYYYQIRAYNDVGNSDYSGSANATTTAIIAPTNLTATAASSSRINLTWQDNSTTETGFKIERKTGSGGTWAQITTVGANATSYADTTLTSSTTYYYQVRAYNNNGNSDYSNAANATTTTLICIAPITLGQAIDNQWEAGCDSTHRSGSYAKFFTFSLSDTTTINITLTSTTDAYLYLLNDTGSGGTVMRQDDNSGGGTNAKIMITPIEGNYTIEATTAAASTTGAFNINLHAATVVPNAPSNVTATVISDTQINLTWQNNSDIVQGFWLYRKTGTGGSYSRIATLGDSITSYNNTGLASNTTYYYKVLSYNPVGPSDPSNEINATTMTTVCIFPILEGQTLSGARSTACASVHRSGKYAKYYTFTLTATKTVTIDLTSSDDSYLFLLNGTGSGGSIIAQDDDSGGGMNSRITRSLAAGNYTIEATTYYVVSGGTFTIRLLTA